MRGKIGLEEHFAVPETVDDPKSQFPNEDSAELTDRMVDLHGRRFKMMDQRPATEKNAERPFRL